MRFSNQIWIIFSKYHRPMPLNYNHDTILILIIAGAARRRLRQSRRRLARLQARLVWKVCQTRLLKHRFSTPLFLIY